MGREARSARASMFATCETYVITSLCRGSAIMLKTMCFPRPPTSSQTEFQSTANRFQKGFSTPSNSASILDHPFWLPSEVTLELSSKRAPIMFWSPQTKCSGAIANPNAPEHFVWRSVFAAPGPQASGSQLQNELRYCLRRHKRSARGS